MDKPWQVVNDLELHSSRLDKEAILQVQLEAGNNEFFRGCRAALDSMITYGVKQVAEKKGDGAGIDAEDFWTVSQQLADRQLTGDAARDAINQLREKSKEREWNQWYRRILIKDLRCGVSEKTVNKVVEKTNGNYVIPVFSCQLAHDGANHESKVSGQKIIEVKLDGVRVITIVYPSGNVAQYSRNGKELVNFPHVVEQLKKVADSFDQPMVLDGEIMSSSFQDLMKQVHRKSDVQSTDAVLNLFDILPLADFQSGFGQQTQSERSELLKSWYQEHQDAVPNVAVVGQELVDLDSTDGRIRFGRINADAIAGGYEGIMIKDPLAIYECKRTVAWLKQKPFIEVSLSIVGFEEGTGRNLGKLGAIIVEGEDDGKLIRTNVGSGLTDDDRDNFWNDRDGLLGRIVEVRADAVTQNQDGSFSLRFPRFKGFRGFAVGEKL
jgi:DNA ligase-1